MIYLVSGVFLTAGAATLFTVKQDTPPANVYGYSVLSAIGAAVFSIGYPIAGIKVALEGGSPREIGAIVSLQNICTQMGNVVPLLISGQIFQTYSFRGLKQVLDGQNLTNAQIKSLTGGSGSALFSSLSPALQLAATKAITKAISKVFILALVCAVIATVGAVGMKRERLFQQPKDTAAVEEFAGEKN